MSDVHVVQWGYNSDNPKWKLGVEALRKAGIPLFVHSTFDQQAQDTLISRALVRVDPALYVSDGALKMLIEQMETRSSLPLFSNEHFAVSSELWIVTDESEKRNLRVWSESALAYGWLLVVLVLDTLRYYINLGSYHRNLDLTARLVSVTYPNRTVLAPHRWWWPWGGLGSGIAAPQSGRGGCFVLPAQGEQGMNFVLRVVRAHRYMGIGVWLVPFALYYCALAFPWWALVLPQAFVPWWMLMSLDPRAWPWYWQMVHLLHLLVVALVSYNQLTLKVPWVMQSVHILLYPLYLATAPAFFMYARFVRSRALYAAMAEHKVKSQ